MSPIAVGTFTYGYDTQLTPQKRSTELPMGMTHSHAVANTIDKSYLGVQYH